MRTHPVIDNDPRSCFRRWHIPVLLALIVGTVLILRTHNPAVETEETGTSPSKERFFAEKGFIFGTSYHIKYQASQRLKDEIVNELNRVDSSLSMFNPQSTISLINRNESTQADSLLCTVWALCQEVCAATDGAFDPTCAPLVNAWGFGYKSGDLPTNKQVDSLRALVGWKQIQLQGLEFTKADPRMVLDFSAVAKGFGVDQVAQLLTSRGVKNFMVEIGGEVVTRGCNPQGNAWRIGIQQPVDDVTGSNKALQQTIEMTDRAVATSGNYRNFRVENGTKIVHTIDPRSGRPVQHNLLSSTVWAPTCAMADAYATSFMVMGVDRAKALLEQHDELRAYFIFLDKEGGTQTWTNYE